MSLMGHALAVNAISYSPDGRFILSGGRDNGLKIWDFTTGKEIRTFKGHSNDVTSVVFSPDGRQALSGSADTTMRLWDVATGTEVRAFASDTRHVSSVAYSPIETKLLSSFGNNLHLWDISSGNRTKVLKGHKDKISQVIYSPDGRYAVSGGGAYNGIADNDLHLWDMVKGRELRTYSGHSNSIMSLAYSSDGQYLLSGSADKTLKLWEASTEKELRTFSEPTGGMYSYVSFSRDGRNVMATQQDLTDVWNPKTFLKQYEISTGNRKNSLEIGSIVSVGYSADKRYAITGRMQLLDVSAAKIIRTYPKYGSSTMSIAFSPDNTYFMTVDGPRLTLWDIPSGSEIRTFTGNSGNFSDVLFSADGKQVIAGGGSGNIVIWDFPTGKEIAQFISFTDGEWVTITPEGYYNSSENGDKHLNVRIGNNVYGIDQYREAFYRPDLVKIALAGGSLKDYRNIASVKQPPQVKIVETPVSTGEGEVKVTLRITDIGGGIGDVRLFLNGSAVVLDSARGMKVVAKDDGKSVIRSYTLKLTCGANSIRAIAFNADNTMQSNYALHEITASFKSISKPAIHALVIGINEFKNPKLQLKYTVADAELFTATLQKSARGLFEKVNVKQLTTKQLTTSENIRKELKALQKLNPDDLFILYVASHGTVDDGEYFLITSNVGSTATARLKSDALAQTELKELVANIPTTKKLIVIDTCNAGALGDAIQTAMLTRGMSEDTAMKVLSRAVGSTILSASTGVQEALEGYKEHGLFTYVLSLGLSGMADYDKDGYIKTTELANYIDDEVPALSERIFKKAQYPTVAPSGQAFPIGKVK